MLAAPHFQTPPMPKKIIPFPAAPKQKPKRPKSEKSAPPQLVREAVFSFLKDTRGMISWSARDLAETLNVTPAQANIALPILEMQGYVKLTGNGEWLTTIEGETVSGSATPRYKREAVEDALKSLRDRIRELNSDRKSGVKIVHAVSYGDFLSDRPRAQAADVGIELTTRAHTDAKRETQILTTLRAKSPMLHLHRFQPWMSSRTHRNLL
ncbi:MAG TPA: hypothetical protein VJN69_12680 [Candidatus Acidoferrales bacterium]|nr:hypothetical protein [Candidatus Acidoferrales bacterium]